VKFYAASPTVCVTCAGAGVDNAWEQEKLEARKMLENAAESHTSGARIVSPLVNGCVITIFFSFLGCREITF
jgi:hypothetical protein